MHYYYIGKKGNKALALLLVLCLLLTVMPVTALGAEQNGENGMFSGGSGRCV